ncbi:IS1096 element passenger TnpR family protein [Flagellimonas abyssi]|uniref:IS1096 element passenger TnpR family protein n=1 Tax=Flagellimonas abyssi TaxID=2864871 RepID=UPI003AAC8292
MHNQRIRVHKPLPLDYQRNLLICVLRPTIPFPICCDGALNRSLEDVAVYQVFYDFLKIMENRKHAEDKETKAWAYGR